MAMYDVTVGIIVEADTQTEAMDNAETLLDVALIGKDIDFRVHAADYDSE